MKLYSGNDGSAAGAAEIASRGMGRMVTAAEWRNPREGEPWALDNGAFSDYLQGKDFDAARFAKVLRKVPPANRPDFAVIPDVVAGGLRSLTYSCYWLRVWTLPHGWPWYLAVQDGMEEKDIAPLVRDVAGIFVGGSLDWKHRTAEAWVAFAHANGLPCHIGRVGTVEDLVWARRIGADSVDSTSWAQNAAYWKVDAARAQRTLAEAAGGVL